MGACLAPMNAFLNVVGLETLGLRMQRICENAQALAEAIDRLAHEQDKKSEPGKCGCLSVNYPTLKESLYHALAETQFGGKGGGAILTVRVGSKENAYQVMDSLKYAKKATNIGDVRTLVIHPASTIYVHASEEQKEAAGVYDDLIRVSVGIEDAKDLIEDFTTAITTALKNG